MTPFDPPLNHRLIGPVHSSFRPLEGVCARGSDGAAISGALLASRIPLTFPRCPLGAVIYGGRCGRIAGFLGYSAGSGWQEGEVGEGGPGGRLVGWKPGP